MNWAISAGPVVPVLIGAFLVAAFVSLLATPSIRRYVRERLREEVSDIVRRFPVPGLFTEAAG